jgi:hypothetical protein
LSGIVLFVLSLSLSRRRVGRRRVLSVVVSVEFLPLEETGWRRRLRVARAEVLPGKWGGLLAIFDFAIFVVIWVLRVLAASVTGDAAAGPVPVVVAASAVEFGAVLDKLEVRRIRPAPVIVAHLLHDLVELIELRQQSLSCLSTRRA